MAVPRPSSNRNNRPHDARSLERLALRYVERYATTRARLKGYLARKLEERGWDGERPDIEALVDRIAAAGYVNDRQFAETRAAALSRRGYGARRISLALKAAGIDAEEARALLDTDEWEGEAMASALSFARRRKLGRFAHEELDQDQRRKAFAAMIRAGHDFEIVRQVLAEPPGATAVLE